MSLIGSIIDYFANGDSTELTDLRSVLPAGRMYGDKLPTGASRPFVVLSEGGASSIAEPKTGAKRSRVEEAVINFDVYARRRGECENIIEALDSAYIDQQLTITNRTHIGTYFGNRQHGLDEHGWVGVLSLRYRVTRQASAIMFALESENGEWLNAENGNHLTLD